MNINSNRIPSPTIPINEDKYWYKAYPNAPPHAKGEACKRNSKVNGKTRMAILS